MSQGRLGRPFLVKSVTVTSDGVTHHGTYYVQGSVMLVRSPLGEKMSDAQVCRDRKTQFGLHRILTGRSKTRVIMRQQIV